MALPRPEYNAYERFALPADSCWYEVYRVLPGVIAICEPGHFQEVISYLITGSDRALLWDTGMGIAPIRPLAECLTALPLTVINSHIHFDHTGGNAEFPFVFAWPAEGTQARAATGYAPAFLAPMMGADSLAKPLPPGFHAETYRIRPWRLAALPGGKNRSRGAADRGAAGYSDVDYSDADYNTANHREDNSVKTQTNTIQSKKGRLPPWRNRGFFKRNQQ